MMEKPRRLGEVSPEMRRRFRQRGREALSARMAEVVPIINDVAQGGDDALAAYTRELDGVWIPPAELSVGRGELDECYRQLDPSLIESLRLMHQRVRQFHQQQASQLPLYPPSPRAGDWLGQRYVPVKRASVYAPGGKARYPSTVIMGCVPARVAGVKDVIVCSPPAPGGGVAPEVAVAADIAGASQIIKAGGAQAIAACAFGTQSIESVDMIVGPGNLYVTAAKTYLASIGQIGIDCPAGPSEVVIVADESASPVPIAWDMIAQAEHDEAAWSILVTPSKLLASRVWEVIQAQLPDLARREIVATSLEKHGCIFVTEDTQEAVRFANEFAPEHVELITAEPEQLLAEITNAGSVFLGPYSPVAIGDYLSGTNHILPTGGAARFASGLGVPTFLKVITFQRLTQETLQQLQQPLIRLTRAEGLPAHGTSVTVRTEGPVL